MNVLFLEPEKVVDEDRNDVDSGIPTKLKKTQNLCQSNGKVKRSYNKGKKSNNGMLKNVPDDIVENHPVAPLCGK